MIAPLYFVLIFVTQWFHFVLGTNERSESFHPPLNIPLVLSANFGELRSNHFHMGLDFKTEAREGLTLHSIDKGYVSRVNVSPYGYGTVVYINHPGGITSVYAHCQRLTGKLDKRVKELQMKTQNSEADIYFQPNEVPLERGEVFALSGNSGASQGPHLHFEIRDTYTEEALNPLLFGFKIADTKAPSAYTIKAYALDEYGYMKEGKTQEWSINNNTLGNGTVTLPSNFCSQKGGLGFAINAIDKFDGASNSCGLYGSRVIVNGDTLMAQELNRVAFEHTRYLNAYTDYQAFRGGRKYHKAFHTEMNPLTIYQKKSKGILFIKPNTSYNIQYDAYDQAGNTSTTTFTLNISDGEINLLPSKLFDPTYLNPNEAWKIDFKDAIIEAPAGCTYEPIPKEVSWNGTSVIFKSDVWPVQEAFTVRLKPRTDYPIKQQYIGVKNGANWSALETEYANGWLEAKSKRFGEMAVQIDDKAPNIVGRNVKETIYKSKTKRLIWGIGDYQTGLVNYGLEVDGKWQVLDYESKGDYASYELNDLELGPHELIVTATDLAGNKRTETFNIVLK
tara:strand:+ start:17642 stop:19327 length:1686 start_codon:yes stop_codon:yes gene_type:complete